MDRQPLANALIVSCVDEDFPTPSVVERIYQFITDHDDEYKVIVAIKDVVGKRFHPDLHAIPDTVAPYDPTNIDFDSVFGGLPPGVVVNDRNESLHSYLQRHGIGHVDLAGFRWEEALKEANHFGYTVSALPELCVTKFS